MGESNDTKTISLLSSEISYRRNVTKKEEYAIINAVEQNVGYLDILSAVSKLKNTKIDSDMYSHWLERFSDMSFSNKEHILLFINNLLEVAPFSELIGTLHYVGFESLSIRIENNISGSTCGGIGHAKLKNGSYLQRFFYSLKSLCDDNGFKCRKGDLDRMINEMISVMNNPDCETTLLQRSMNKLAVLTWLRVQQCQNGDDVRSQIMKMLKHTPRGIDDTIIKIVYESKSAVAMELDGNTDTADYHIENAAYLAQVYSDPLTTSLLFHDKRYVRQLRFMRRKTDGDRREVQSECYQGLSYFSAFQTELCTFMKRILSLYTVHNLLKIGHNFEVDVSEKVSTDEIEQASNILTCLQSCFQSGLLLEQRRKMIYCVLKARLHEFGGDILTAKSFLSVACDLMPDGAFFEIEERNLAEFRSRLLYSQCVLDF